MKRLLLISLLMLFTGITQATVINGSLNDPNQVFEFDFSLANDSNVSVWTESGLTQSGRFFDLTLAIWQYDSVNADWLLLTANDDANGSFGSGNGLDSGVILSLITGNYRVTVTGSMNNPFGPFLSDGFNGNGANIPNNIGEFLLHFDGTPSSVPNPGTLWLLGLGFLALLSATQRKNHNVHFIENQWI